MKDSLIVVPANPTFAEMMELFTRLTGQVVKGEALAYAQNVFDEMYAPKLAAGKAYAQGYAPVSGDTSLWRAIDQSFMDAVEAGDVHVGQQFTLRGPVSTTRRHMTAASFGAGIAEIVVPTGTFVKTLDNAEQEAVLWGADITLRVVSVSPLTLRMV